MHLLLFALVGAPVLASVPERIFEMTGKIYIKKDLPKACENVHVGISCDSTSIGSFRAESFRQGPEVYSKTQFLNAKGEQVLEESWRAGEKLVRAKILNRQLKIKTSVEVKDGKAYFTLVHDDGRKEEAKESVDDSVVVPSTLMAYLKPRMKSLIAGSEVTVKMAVLDRKAAYTFDIKKMGTTKGVAGAEVLVLRMKPANWIIAQIVDPMFFYLDQKGDRLIGFDGRSALRREDGDKLRDIDAKVAYNVLQNL
jgi:hypothetical protein